MTENEKYHLDTTHISKSGLDLIRKAPAKYWEKYLNPNKEIQPRNDDFAIGSAFHSIILEPELFKDEFVIHQPFIGEGSQKRRQQLIEMNPGKELLSIKDYDKINYMHDAVMNHPIASKLFLKGFAEKIFKWTDPHTNVKCKIKPDFFNTERNFIVDLKTTDDASQNGFERSSFKYRYHVQSSFYYDGMKQNGINVDAFIFVAVEKEPPYLVNVFFAPQNSLDFGRETYIEDLQTYANCKNTGIWHGYSEEIKPLNLPSWLQ
jgi:exodeoxyribonuclease VIII